MLKTPPTVWVVLAAICLASPTGLANPRARDLGMSVGVLAPGPKNSIVDVAGVRGG